MKTHTFLFFGWVLVASPVVAADTRPDAGPSKADSRLAPWTEFISEAALRFDMPRSWINRVVIAESGGQTHLSGRPIVSEAGAMGLMQLMPGTYEDMRHAYNLGPDPYDPHDNILAGTAYLKAMFERYGYPGLFAAYNAGPTRFEASLRGVPLPLETQDYLLKLTARRPILPPIAPLFVVGGGSENATANDAKAGLFAVRLSPEDLDIGGPAPDIDIQGRKSE